MIREEPGGGQEGKQGRILRDNIKTGEKQGKHMEETGEDININEVDVSKQMIREPYPKKS